MAQENQRVDAFSPAEVTAKVLDLAVSKTALSFGRQLPLTILAGIYIGIGGIFSALFTGEASKIKPLMWIAALAFLVYFFVA